MLAGAIRRDSSRDWDTVANRVRRKLINVYHKKDYAMKIYKKAHWGQNPCGRKNIKITHPNLVQVDARSFYESSSHDKYFEYFPSLIGKWMS